MPDEPHTFHLTPERGKYLAEVIGLGNSALGNQSPTALVSEIAAAILDCPNGCRITVEAHQ
jgi:hypothetical protein